MRLHRRSPGSYYVVVRAKDSGLPPREITVESLIDPNENRRSVANAGYRWVVDTGDVERPFHSLADARDHLDRFFEEVR